MIKHNPFKTYDAGQLTPYSNVEGFSRNDLIEHLENTYPISGNQLGRYVRQLHLGNMPITLFFPRKIGLTGPGWPDRHWGIGEFTSSGDLYIKPGIDGWIDFLPAYERLYNAFNLEYCPYHQAFLANNGEPLVHVYFDGNLYAVVGGIDDFDYWLYLKPINSTSLSDTLKNYSWISLDNTPDMYTLWGGDNERYDNNIDLYDWRDFSNQRGTEYDRA